MIQDYLKAGYPALCVLTQEPHRAEGMLVCDDWRFFAWDTLSVYAYLTAYPEFNLKGDIPVALLYLVRTKTPQVIWQTSTRSLDDLVDLFHLVLMVATAIETQQYWKNPGMHCSWCDFKPICFNDEAGIEEKFGCEIFQRQEQDALYC